MPNIESSIQWFQDRKGKVTYSMTNRRGPASYDCSSSVYYALIQGGFFPVGIYIGNTESEFGDLEKYGFKQVQANANGSIDAKRGDVFIWGKRGSSAGSNGHTGIFLDPANIIHCSYGYNGIAVSNHDWLASINGVQYLTIYRYVGGGTPTNEPVDQVINPGSWIKFPGTYTVDDVQNISDVWQVRTNQLCPVGFTWADNGIPAGPIVEVDADGYATPDQSLDVGSRYIIPGKYQVLDVGQSNGRWLGQISIVGLKFWVDLEPVTEVSANDGGTPTPANRPNVPPVTPPVVVPEPPVVVKPVEPSTPNYDKENNTLLQQILAIVKSILDKLTSIFK